MTIYNFPFSGTSPGRAGPYTAELFALLDAAIHTGLLRPDAGVAWNTGNGVDDPLEVQQTSPASQQVQVTAGFAWVNGRRYYSDSTETLAISPNTDGSGFARIDLVVLRRDTSAQTVDLVVLEGTPAAIPVAPTLTQTSVQYEIPLAEIAVANLFTTIVTANIDNTVRSFARLLNWREGGTGISSYALRQKLIGQTDGSVALEYLSGFAVQLTSTSGALASGSYQTIPLTSVLSDPDSLISVGSNRITFLQPGWYSCFGVTFFPAFAATAQARLRLRDVTNGATLCQAKQVAVGRSSQSMDKPFQILNANDQAEFQIYGASNVTITVDTLPAGHGDGTDAALVAHFIRWGNN